MEQKLNSNSSAGTAADSDMQSIVIPSADIAVNPVLAEEGNLGNENFYCPTCESCGYDECCSFVKCFRKLIENDKCDNGSQYLADAIFSRNIMQLADEVFNKLENGLFDAKLAVEQYRKEWHEIYDKVYKADG